MPDGCTPVWTGSNHDVSRFPTRWADGDAGRDAVRADDAAHAARQRVPLLRRRDRDARHRRARATGCSTRSASRSPRCTTATRRARRCTWSGAPGAGFTAAGRRAVAAVRRPRAVQRRGPARRPGVDPAPRAATSSRCARAVPDLRDRRVRSRSRRPATSGPGGAASGVVVAVNLGDEPASLDGVTRDGSGQHRSGARRRDGRRLAPARRLAKAPSCLTHTSK